MKQMPFSSMIYSTLSSGQSLTVVQKVRSPMKESGRNPHIHWNAYQYTIIDINNNIQQFMHIEEMLVVYASNFKAEGRTTRFILSRRPSFFL